MPSPRSDRPLRVALAFAALGGPWALQIAALLRVGCFGHDGPLGPALVVLLPITLATVGLVMGQNLHRRIVAYAGLALAALPAAGMLLGVVVGIVWWPPDGIVMGSHDGLLLGLAAVPFLVPLLVASRDLGRARERSLLDRVDGYGLWAAVGVSCALSSMATLPRWNVYPRCGVADAGAQTSSGWVGVACACGGLVLAGCMWVAQRRVGARIRSLRSAPVDAKASRPVLVDLGLGEGRWEREIASPTAYRSIHAADLVVRGDAEPSYLAAAASARRTVLLALAGAVALLVSLYAAG
jgi:hypothetical protein